MKILKKLAFIILVLILTVPVFTFTVFAENGTHLDLLISSEQIHIGETLKITVQNHEMSTITFIGSILYDNELLELINMTSGSFEVEGGRPVNISTESNRDDGVIALILIGTNEKKYKANADVLELTFTAKKAGTAYFYISESSDGTDGRNADNVVAASIDIKDEGNSKTDGIENITDNTENEEKKIKDIHIVVPPDNTKYALGDSFNPEGMQVEVIYDDGTSEIIENYEVDKIILDETCNSVIISYDGHKAEQAIQVNKTSSGSNSIVVIVVIIVILIIAVFILTYFLLRKNGREKIN